MKYIFIDASENQTMVQFGTESNFIPKTIDTNRNLAAKITKIFDDVLLEAGWSQNELTHLVACTGPGSLTGIRVALAFMRTLAMLLDKPLLGIDLFSWSIETLSKNDYKGEARFVIPTLIDKAFEVKANFPEKKATEPILIEKKDILSEAQTFGIRYKHQGIQELQPSPEALHKLILSAAPSSKGGFDEILKVLPLYIIPSQAERNFKGADR